jgi:hypothetical protein
VLTFAKGVVLIVVVAVLSTVLLSLLLSRLREHVKFFLLFAFLILIYSLAKQLHLSSLLLVLVFGLAVNNADLLLVWHRLAHRRPHPIWTSPKSHHGGINFSDSHIFLYSFWILHHAGHLHQLAVVGAERTDSVVAVLTAARFLYMRYVARTDLLPDLFIAPKGLITLLLLYGIAWTTASAMSARIFCS